MTSGLIRLELVEEENARAKLSDEKKPGAGDRSRLFDLGGRVIVFANRNLYIDWHEKRKSIRRGRIPRRNPQFREGCQVRRGVIAIFSYQKEQKALELLLLF
jgi:hypothetical protein